MLWAVASDGDSEYWHDAAYRQKRERGQAGWDAKFDVRDLACLMISRFAPERGAMLDIGCGGGESSVFFAELGVDVTAVDFSTAALELARSNAREKSVDITFVRHDMREPLPFADGAFGFAVDHRAFHCLVESHERSAFLREVHRVLRPRSLFYSSTIAGLPRDPDLLRDVDVEARANYARTRYFGEADDILREFVDAGFTLASWQIIREPYRVDNLITYARR
jgi:SAM-dependent methyltransferase